MDNKEFAELMAKARRNEINQEKDFSIMTDKASRDAMKGQVLIKLDKIK